MLPGLIVRPAVLSDLPALEWEGEFTHFRRLYADTYQRAERGEAIVWIAELPGEGLVGQLFVSLKSERSELSDGQNRAYVYGFRVRPNYRNTGVGTQMMQVTENDLLKRGFRCVTLNVGQENPGARRLYERLGYQVVGDDPGRWFYLDEKGNRCDVNEPAWRMEKQLYGEARN